MSESFTNRGRAKEATVSAVAAFLDQVNPNRARPVRLQVNTGGAWRNVIDFDAGKEVACGEVMAAADMLARIGKATCRIVMANSNAPRSPTVLMNWTPDRGWQEAK
jgi:hypothetical protein